MAELTTNLTQDDLKKIITSLAQRISSDYDGCELLCKVCALIDKRERRETQADSIMPVMSLMAGSW